MEGETGFALEDGEICVAMKRCPGRGNLQAGCSADAKPGGLAGLEMDVEDTLWDEG